MYGKYLDPSTVQIEAYRQKQGARVQDSDLSLKLSNGNILNARTYFNPEIISDIKVWFW